MSGRSGTHLQGFAGRGRAERGIHVQAGHRGGLERRLPVRFGPETALSGNTHLVVAPGREGTGSSGGGGRGPRGGGVDREDVLLRIFCFGTEAGHDGVLQEDTGPNACVRERAVPQRRTFQPAPIHCSRESPSIPLFWGFCVQLSAFAPTRKNLPFCDT